MAKIQKIAEVQNERVHSWSPSRGLESFSPDTDRIEAFVDVSRNLSSQLLRLSVSEAESAFASTLECLAMGLSADRVSLLLPGREQEIFEWAQDWERVSAPGGGVGWVLELSSMPSLARTLREGVAHRGRPQAGMKSANTQATSVGESGWQSGSSTLYLPCCGAEGLLGVVVVEAGLSAAYWTRASVAAALGVAETLAAFLGRRRLSVELEAERARRGHDAQLQLLGRVSSSVAHDFNNLLTAILGYADLLELELPDGAAGRAELLEIREAANRATHLVDEVLSFGRPRPRGLEPIDLADSLEGLMGIMRRLVGASVEIELDLDTDLAAIRVDPGAFERIVLNLASNARDAIEATGRGSGRFVLEARCVSVGSESADPLPSSSKDRAGSQLAPGRYLRLAARDDGCGLDPRAREHLFESFFTTKGPGDGNGLGLATAAEVMRGVGGTIRLAEQSGQGTAFHLYFPIGEPENALRSPSPAECS